MIKEFDDMFADFKQKVMSAKGEKNRGIVLLFIGQKTD